MNSIDNGASSANGGVGYFQLARLTGFTRCTGRILHSTDDSTWVTLIVFSTMNAIDGERLEVTGTVNRYLAFEFDGDGGIGDGNDLAKMFCGFRRY